MSRTRCEELTEKQRGILESIVNYIETNKISPTIRELCSINKLKSTGTVQDHLQKLKSKGYITYIEHSGRSIVVLNRGD